MTGNCRLPASTLGAGVRGIAVAVLAALILAACGSQTSSQPTLTKQQIVGSWVSPDGGGLVLKADNYFTATNIRLGYPCQPSGRCPRFSGSGTWEFAYQQGQPAGLQMLQGNLLELLQLGATRPQPKPSWPPPGLAPYMTLSSWLGGPFWDTTPELCEDIDPDSPCDGYYFTKRK